MGLGACGVIILAVTGIRFNSFHESKRGRDISFEQLTTNLSSIASRSSTDDLDNTKQWRLDWWGEIIKYTINGKLFWTGKGFGINLADDDGFKLDAESTLRSPHNGHMTILARMGVPGLVLWVLVQLSWAWGILGGYIRATGWAMVCGVIPLLAGLLGGLHRRDIIRRIHRGADGWGLVLDDLRRRPGGYVALRALPRSSP